MSLKNGEVLAVVITYEIEYFAVERVKCMFCLVYSSCNTRYWFPWSPNIVREPDHTSDCFLMWLRTIAEHCFQRLLAIILNAAFSFDLGTRSVSSYPLANKPNSLSVIVFHQFHVLRFYAFIWCNPTNYNYTPIHLIHRISLSPFTKIITTEKLLSSPKKKNYELTVQ